MDPKQCYLEMLAAWQRGDRRLARDRALALDGWLTRGGFSPQEFEPAEVRAKLAEVLRHTVGINLD